MLPDLWTRMQYTTESTMYTNCSCLLGSCIYIYTGLLVCSLRLTVSIQNARARVCVCVLYICSPIVCYYRNPTASSKQMTDGNKDRIILFGRFCLLLSSWWMFLFGSQFSILILTHRSIRVTLLQHPMEIMFFKLTALFVSNRYG